MKKKINNEEFSPYIKRDTLRTTVVLLALVAIVLVVVFSSCAVLQPKQDDTPCWKGAEPKHRTSKMRA